MEQHNQKNKKWASVFFNIFFGVVIMAAIGGALTYWLGALSTVYSNDAQVQQLISPVNARIGGYIKEIRFEEFQYVKAGDTLAKIDQTDLLIQKNLAAAGLEDAVAARYVASSSLSIVKNIQTISDANIEEAKVRLWNAEVEFRRFNDLLTTESVTQQQFDHVKAEYESLKAKYRSLLSTRKGSVLSTNEALSKLKVHEALIKKARANLAMAEQNLKYSIITASCNGIAGRKTINVGQLIQPGQSIIMVIDDHDKWVTVNFKEKQLQQVQVGGRVSIRIDAIPGKEFKGTIESIAGATGSVFSLVPTDNSTGNFVKVQQRVPVRVAFERSNEPNLMAQLRSGMNAEVFVDKN